MKSVPPIIPITFSDRYLARAAPPDTAIPVATAWAAMAPAATLTGFCAADKAMVDKKDRSPNSAAKTKPKILNSRALDDAIEFHVFISVHRNEKNAIVVRKEEAKTLR